MSQPEHPNLRRSLLPPKPEPEPAPQPEPPAKGKKGRKKPEPEPEPEPTTYELAEDDLSNVGPVLLRARTIHDNYILMLKGDVALPFHRANWTASGDDSFITLYRKTAEHWEVTDVCIDDISTVAITLPSLPE